MELAPITVTRDDTLRLAMDKLNASGRGILILADSQGRFERTITDGDLRRELLAGRTLAHSLASIGVVDSITAHYGASRREALALMNDHQINQLPLLNQDRVAVAILDRKEIDAPVLLSSPHMGETEQGFVEEAFRSNWIAPLGPLVDQFERRLASLAEMGHAAAVSSGTAAIHLALRLLDIGPGDTVFCSTLTFAASANPVVYLGARPVFIDSDARSWNMCPNALASAFASAERAGTLPKAVIVVNLYGQSADYDAILAICDPYGVPVVEDAAESLGARYKDRPSGSCGKLSIFSFNGNKIITTSGGGMLLGNDKQLIDRARFLATQARDPAPHYEHSEIGYNYRLSNILAGVGLGQLDVLADRVEARRAIFYYYREHLADISAIEWMPEPEWSYSNRWLSTCTLRRDCPVDRERLRLHLADELIEARPVWKPMHRQPVFADCEYHTADNASISDDLFERGLCLPSGSNLTKEQLDRIIDAIRAAF